MFDVNGIRVARFAQVCLLLSLVTGCASVPPRAEVAPPSGSLDRALASVTVRQILGHVRALASDAFEGRAPGSAGEEKTVDYLVAVLRKLGLSSGTSDGSFIQTVPLVGLRAKSEGWFEIGSDRMDLSIPSDAVFLSRHPEPETEVFDSDIVFVGYGVVAPENGWDDFKGEDLRKKTLLMLVGDPPVPDPSDPSRLDDRVFAGRAMTYYGRWTYKFESASALGAAAVLIIHETGPAGYGFDVVRSGFEKETFDLGARDSADGRVPIEGWISLERTRALLARTGHDLETLKRAALDRSFRPIRLGAKANLTAHMTRREIESTNVVARLEGRDPAHRHEAVMYTAHWDHLGQDPSREGDGIFNGALDNGSGVAEVLAIAEAFAHAQKPRRSVVFLFPTSEESGLQGARYYANRPVIPLEDTLADINLDIMNFWGRTKAVVSVGKGSSTLDDTLSEIARKQGRVIVPDPEPEKGYFYRSDHFELVKRGVPALHFLHPGASYVDQPSDYGQRRRDAYVARDYHKVSDDVKADWDLEGAVEDVRLLFETGYRVAEGEGRPQWLPGSEFKRVREDSLEKRRAAR